MANRNLHPARGKNQRRIDREIKRDERARSQRCYPIMLEWVRSLGLDPNSCPTSLLRRVHESLCSVHDDVKFGRFMHRVSSATGLLESPHPKARKKASR